jgi:phosphoglycolate phosphatase
MTSWNSAICAAFGEQGPALCLLDLDGTLIDSVPDLAAAIDSMLQQLGRPPAGEAAVSWCGARWWTVMNNRRRRSRRQP